MQRRGGERSQDLGRRQWRRRQPGAPLCRHKGQAGRQAGAVRQRCRPRHRVLGKGPCQRSPGLPAGAAHAPRGCSHSEGKRGRPAPRGRGQQPSRWLQGPRPAPPLSPARTRGSGAGQGGWAAPPPQGHGCAPVPLRDPLLGQRHHCLRAAALTCLVRSGPAGPFPLAAANGLLLQLFSTDISLNSRMLLGISPKGEVLPVSRGGAGTLSLCCWETEYKKAHRERIAVVEEKSHRTVSSTIAVCILPESSLPG